MNLDKVKKELKQYIETRRFPALVFFGIFGLVVIALSPHDIVEKSLSKSGFTVVYILILCLTVLIGNLDKPED